jgi:hypothetical protein
MRIYAKAYEKAVRNCENVAKRKVYDIIGEVSNGICAPRLSVHKITCTHSCGILFDLKMEVRYDTRPTCIQAYHDIVQVRHKANLHSGIP